MRNRTQVDGDEMDALTRPPTAAPAPGQVWISRGSPPRLVVLTGGTGTRSVLTGRVNCLSVGALNSRRWRYVAASVDEIPPDLLADVKARYEAWLAAFRAKARP